jgi:hypothetical protein|tara:strand:+ start:5793 stop:6041 length:249 start_codon:yes stop_codon:yes gene_type:complete
MTDAWKESGAMVYVALTVATFAAVLTCCVWIAKKHRKKTYIPVDSDGEEVELTAEEELIESAEFTLDDSEEEIDMEDIDEPV